MINPFVKNLIRFLLISLAIFIDINNCNSQTDISAGNSNQNYPGQYSYPLKLAGQGKRYLVDQKNKPFFWSGDTGWSLIAQLSREEADLYLTNRQEKGFTVILVNLIEHKFSSNAPANYYKDPPFTGKPFVTPNEKYFEHADHVLRLAAEKNLIILLDALYLGYNCGDEGWCEDVKSASAEDLKTWGRYLGKRYKDFPNIVWVAGGDTDPSVVKDKILEMVKGIREFDPIHLFSGHNSPEMMGADPWPGENWMTINNVYSYDSVLYGKYKQAFELRPVMPYFEIESAYENEHRSTPQQLRSQAYWAILSGAMGHVFGNCPLWHFGSWPSWCNLSDWKSEMDNKGSESMDYLQRLFRSRKWETLIPDFSHKVLISGYGQWGFKNYTAAALTADGNTLIAYLPSMRKIAVDMSKMSGKRSNCWWYDPSKGNAEFIGTFNNSGTKSLIPSSKGDIILVIDNAEMKMSSPGSFK